MKTKETIAIIALITLAVFCGGVLAIKVALPKTELNAGAAGVSVFTGVSTQASTLISSSASVDAVPRTSGRTYLKICRTNQQATNLTQISLAVNASASAGRGIILDSTNRCWESNDLNLVTGLIEGIASPSAASISYSQW